MSVPNYFYTKDLERLEMSPTACSALFHFLLPKFKEMDLELAAKFSALYKLESWGVEELPENAKQYMQAYHWIMQACDEIADLTPYKDALNKALMADPRFQHKQAA